MLSRLFWPHVGGVEKHVFGLSQQLQKLGYEITVVTEQYDRELVLEEKIEGIKVFRIPAFRVGESAKKWVIWKWLWQNCQILDMADVIHVHDIFYWVYFYKLTHPFKKIYVTFHGWEGTYPIRLKNILHKRLGATLATGNICVGSYIAKWYGIQPDFVTYGAAGAPRRPPTSNLQPPILLFLGRLSEDTGLRECVAKYTRLKDKSGWHLVIAGDGPLRHIIPPEAKFLGFTDSPPISQAKYVFTTGYLGILEAFLHHKMVLAYYGNPVKKDYLLMHPMAKYLIFDDNLSQTPPETPFIWAKNQTWAKLANLYLQLWSSPSSTKKLI